MKRTTSSNPSFEKLRTRVQALFDENGRHCFSESSKQELMRHLNEIEKQHAELKIQNEELRRALLDSDQLEKTLSQSEHLYRSLAANRAAEIHAQFNELQELNAIIEKLSNKTIEAMENDRQALAKEIHDSIAGTLAAIKMQLEDRIDKYQNSEDMRLSDSMSLEEIVEHMQGAILETKRISNHLRSVTLDEYGLKPAFIEHLNTFNQFYPDVKIIYRIDLTGVAIPSETKTVLYRVFQEALNNIGKHSKATEVRLKLTNQHGNRILLEIKDDGCGFDVPEVLSDKDSMVGFGLNSMRERVEICKGSFMIRSEPGIGTTISINIPIANANRLKN